MQNILVKKFKEIGRWYLSNQSPITIYLLHTYYTSYTRHVLINCYLLMQLNEIQLISKLPVDILPYHLLGGLFPGLRDDYTIFIDNYIRHTLLIVQYS